MLRRRGERSRRGGGPERDSKRHEAEGGVRAHCGLSQYVITGLLCDCVTYLDLESFRAAKREVVHFDVRVVGIAAALVLDESEAVSC